MLKNSKKNKKFILISLMFVALIVIAGLSSVVYAASNTGSTAQVQNDRGILDPFSLNIVLLNYENEIVSRPAIRITTRPILRSYFRPPLIY